MNTSKHHSSTETLVIGAILTALVVILQYMGQFIRLGMFSISLVLIPIVIGAAVCGPKISTWLGFVFGVVVLYTDAAAFMAISIPGTVITVLAKGIVCGLTAGIVYRLIAKKNRYLATIVAAIACPIANTGVFLLGCVFFFLDTIREWGISLGFENVIAYMFLGLVGGNFLVEMASNILLSPIVVRVLHIIRKA
ncbi:MAG: ECF transporter S component [Lachnospiraceae bacterium]|nr:ECF transporter S component [Lachnospiraceae bacterium]